MCIVVGFIFSCHGALRFWNAVFIEALTVVKMTAVWSHTVCAPTFLIRENGFTLGLTLTRTKTAEMDSLTSISSNALVNVQ